MSSLGIFLILYDTGKAISMNSTGKIISNFDHLTKKFTSFSILGEQIYFGANDGSILAFTLRSYRLIQEFGPLHQAAIKSLFANKNLYVYYNDSIFQVINLPQNRIINQLYGLSTSIKTVSWYDKWNAISASNCINI